VLQDLHVSVGRTWRFVTSDGTLTVSKDLRGYRRQIDVLKSGTGGNGFRLPWPEYRSTLWSYMFDGDYRNTRSALLVHGLLPLLSDGMLKPRLLESPSGVPFAYLEYSEAFLHPFAVTTVIHLSLLAPEPGSTGNQEPSLLEVLLRHPLAAGQPGQVRDGAPISMFPLLAAQDSDHNPAQYEPASTFVSLSGVHQVADPQALAYQLASLYTKTATNKGQPMHTDQSAISVTDRHVAMLLPERRRSRIGCLHHNITTLLACMENLAAVVPHPATSACGWFQQQAALLLNCLYRRAPLPVVNGIYKSRAAEMWIEHRGLASAINRVNAQAETPPLELP
jgi:hypothetical protein